MSYLYYADRLNQLPLGVVGIAVGCHPPTIVEANPTRAGGGCRYHRIADSSWRCPIARPAVALALLATPSWQRCSGRAFRPRRCRGNRRGALGLCGGLPGFDWVRSGPPSSPARHGHPGQGCGRGHGGQSGSDTGLDAVSGACRDRSCNNDRRLGKRADPALALGPTRAFPVRRARSAQPAAGRGRSPVVSVAIRSCFGSSSSQHLPGRWCCVCARSSRWSVQGSPPSPCWLSLWGSPIGEIYWAGCAGNPLDRRVASAITGAAIVACSRSNEPHFFRHSADR